jgi:segregation and condensation protein A
MAQAELFSEDYKVNLDVFEGPLDLLLYLIRREELDIYDIPIGRVTEQYMEYLDLMRQLNLDVAGEFIVMAATLMVIKSRMLLPVERRAAEEGTDEDWVDPRLDLVRQLIEYKKFKDAAGRLGQYELYAQESFKYGGGRPVFKKTSADAAGALESVDIPSSVEIIGMSAFFGCESLKSVVLESTQGWYAGENAIEAEALIDAKTLASLLTQEYSSYAWTVK